MEGDRADVLDGFGVVEGGLDETGGRGVAGVTQQHAGLQADGLEISAELFDGFGVFFRALQAR